MAAMADGVFIDFLGKIAMGFGLTLALLAIVGSSIPARVKVARPYDRNRNSL